MGMGRKSIGKKLVERFKDEEETDEVYLVSYDFLGEESHHRFWNNLKDVISGLGGIMIQYSVYLGPRKGAKAVRELASGYGAEVRWFVAIELR